MFKPRYLLLLIALAAVSAVGYVLRESESRTAASLLAAAERRLGEDSPDYNAALRELDRALELALQRNDTEVAREAFLTRARTYVERGILGKARTDFTTVVTEYAPGAPEVAIEIGEIDLALENHGAALAAAEAVLATDPNHSAGLTLRGRALYRMGEIAMTEAEAIFDAVLPDEDAKRARDLAWYAATLEFDHPHRAAAVSELGTFPETLEELEGVRRYVDVATSCLTQARTCLVQALERNMSAGALVQLLVLLERGGRWNDVVGLGVPGSSHTDVQRDIGGVSALANSLEQLGRPAFAASILSEANAARIRMPAQLLATWCKLLYEAEDWNRLDGVSTVTMNAAKAVTGPEGRDLKATAGLFGGYAKLELGKRANAPEQREELLEEAKQFFKKYITQPPRFKPIPYALGWAHYGMAMTWAELGGRYEVHLNLQRAVDAAPDIDAVVWEALADAQLAQKLSAGTAAESLFRAIDRATPQERGRLMERWDELSQVAMKERKRTLEASFDEASERGVFVLRNDPQAPSWEFYQMGLQYAEEGKWRGALGAGRALVGRRHEHVLGLDLLIRGNSMNGRWPKVTELLLRRAKAHGPHPETRRMAREIPPGLISPEDFLKLMEFDPQSTGLLPMVETLRREGRTDLAIRALEAVPKPRRTPEAALRLAELQAESGLLPQALRTAGEVDIQTDEGAAAIELALAVATDMRKPGLLEELIPTLLEGAREVNLEPLAAERSALWLLAHDQIGPARVLLETLDRPGVRSGANLTSLGLTLLARSSYDLAEESLDRAEPFLTSAEAQIGRLALLAKTERWIEIPPEVELLRATEHTPAPWVDAALLALQERVGEAAGAAALALEEDGAEPEWLLILAAANALLPEEDRLEDPNPNPTQTTRFLGAVGPDPRALLVLLVTLETPSGAAWAHRELTKASAEGGRLWPPWLMARAYDRLGHPARASESLEALVRNVPAFEPAWRRLEEDLVRDEVTRLAAPYTAFVERRAKALGLDPETDPLSAALVRVQVQARKGKLGEALTFLERLRPALAESPIGLVNHARVQRLAGLRVRAVQDFARALTMVPAAEAAAVVEEFIALGTEAYLERSLPGPAWRAHLSAVRELLPADPLVSLAWARFERQTADDPSVGWDLARAEYERFRDATGWASLDSLRPGGAAAWAAFFLSESPSEAEPMIRSELLLSPGSPDLWRLLGQALEEQGQSEEAFERYTALANILPDPQTLRRAAHILADRGSDHELLEQTLERILSVERAGRAGGPDLEVELLRARSLAHSSAEGVTDSIPLFRKLWARRDGLRTPRSRIDLAESYAGALLQRGDPADQGLIQDVLNEALPRVSDPVRRDLFLAYANLSQWMPEPVLEEEAETERSPANRAKPKTP